MLMNAFRAIQDKVRRNQHKITKFVALTRVATLSQFKGQAPQPRTRHQNASVSRHAGYDGFNNGIVRQLALFCTLLAPVAYHLFEHSAHTILVTVRYRARGCSVRGGILGSAFMIPKKE